jgi:uncharacterized protein (DUF1800 family)
MKLENILSLRLGFHQGLANSIAQKGIRAYVQELLDNPLSMDRPSFIHDETTFMELRKQYNQDRKNLFGGRAPETDDEREQVQLFKKKWRQSNRIRFEKLKDVWIQRMYKDGNPLQEKLTAMFHNHYVVAYEKLDSPSALFTLHNIIRTNAFGNLKTLTKEVLYSNAMIYYLDNQQNNADKPNENLSRELLELFTLGIGNYTEKDIKEGARALAGLDLNPDRAVYRPKKEDKGTKVYLGKTGNLKADDMIEAIFAHENCGDLFAQKLLKCFLTDDPSKKQIKEYGNAFRKSNFEMKPVLLKLFTEENFALYAGQKIKDPLTFALQSFYTIGFQKVPFGATNNFLRQQGMNLFNPPNVKGWDGGRTWLDTGKLLSRNQAVNNLFVKNFVKVKKKEAMMMAMTDNATMTNSMQSSGTIDGVNMEVFNVTQPEDEDASPDRAALFTSKITWSPSAKTNLDIIKELTDALIVKVDEDMQKNMEALLKYDFDINAVNAQESVKLLAKYIMKSPEFQIV